MIRPKELIAAVLLLTLLGFTYSSPGDNGFASLETVTHVHMNELDTALDNLEAGTSIAAGITRDTEWDTEGEVQTAWGSVNIILETEFDASSELRALMDDESGTGALLFAAGDIGAGTAATATAGDNDTSIATTAFVTTAVNAKSAASSTDNAIARFDSTSGDVQNSGVIVDDSNNVNMPGDLTTGSGGTTDPTYFMFRDSDDAGYTECAALNGTFSCAIDADGVIDGTL